MNRTNMNFDRYKQLAIQLVDGSDKAWGAQIIGLAVAGAMSFVMPVKHFLFLVGALVIADMFTGWRAAKRTSGARFNSKGMGGTIEKTVLYMLAILLCRGVDVSFGLDDTIGVTYFVAGLITGRELLSNLENIDKASGSTMAERVRDRFGGLFGEKPPQE